VHRPGEPGPLVGRDGELRLLDAAYRRAVAGVGSTVLVTGEPGAGKTYLVGRCADRWQAGGALVLSGSCQQYGAEEFAYAPFVAAWARVEVDGERGFGALLAGLARLGELPAEVGRAWLFDRVAHHLDRLGADRPVVLVVEDLHWADSATLSLTGFLARSAGGRRLLLVGTARSDGADRLGAAEGLLELLSSGQLRPLPLGPLPPPAARALVLGVLDPGSDAGPVDDRLVDDLAARSGGNPYLAYELATAARQGVAGLPDTLRRVLRRRLHGHGHGAAVAVATVALAGEVPVEVLQAALATVLDRRAAAVVGALIEAGLLEPGHLPGGLRTRHPLLGEVATAELTAGQTRAVHCALAAGWAADRATARTEQRAIGTARHWEAAGESGSALAAWLSAGRSATAAGAYGAAAHAYTRVVDLAGRPDVPVPVGRDRLAVEAADALLRVGDDEQAVRVLRASLAGARIPDPAGRLALLDRLQDCLFSAGQAAAAFTVLEEAAALVPDLPPTREAARIVAADGSRLMILGRYAEGARRSAGAARLAAELGADDTLAYAWTTEGVCLAAGGDLPAGRARLTAARRLAGACGGLAVEARAAINLCYVLANVGEYAGCVHAGREALARLSTRSLAHTLGAPLYSNTVVALVALGAWDEALALAAHAEEAGVPARTVGFLALSRARVAALRGQPEPAEAALRTAGSDRPAGEPAFDVEHALASVLTLRLQRRPRDALTAARDCLRGSPGGVDHLRLCAEALRTLADLEAAGGRVRRLDDPAAVRAGLLEAAATGGGTWGTHSPEAAALRLLCTAEAGRLDDPGPQPWEEVARRWDALGLRYDAAYARMRLAEALVTTRRPKLAADPLREAYATAGELAARPLLTAVEAVARRGRVPLPGRAGPAVPDRPPDPAGAGGADPRVDTLTGREHEVLALLCLGRTNRQIARQLVISERTTEVHVSNVMTKLGAGNRVEAVRLARDLLP
jgi:DNA-binding CsgD family transcriptional regulator/tetratricopeptide (TPR) repeat protein